MTPPVIATTMPRRRSFSMPASGVPSSTTCRARWIQLRRHDEARRRIMEAFEMPDRVGDGMLSRKIRQGELNSLRDHEARIIKGHRQPHLRRLLVEIQIAGRS